MTQRASGLRVAMVSEHASPLAALGGVDSGGQNVHVAALATAIARRGAHVVVHTRRDDEQLPDRVRAGRGVSVDHVRAGPAAELPKDELLPYMGEFAKRLTAAWRRETPDVVHAHFWMSAHAALIAAREVGVPVIQTFHALGTVKRRHQGANDTSPSERLAIERRIAADVDHIIATCTDEVFELGRIGAERDRITVIPCGVDPALFTPDGPRAERRPGRSRLLYIGRLVERKGIGDVIAALPRLPDAELIIAGGPDRERLAEDPDARRLAGIARRLGVTDRVELRGGVRREEVPPLIRSADVVVSVPWYEPFGIVPLEAMACGVPVIGSAAGGMLDSIADGQTGIHVPPRNPERLAEEAAKLAGDAELRRRLGRAGVKRARRLYDWNRIAAATLDVYEHVVDGRRRRPRSTPPPQRPAHIADLRDALPALADAAPRIEAWGAWLAARLAAGSRLLAAGNGGSAAEAQHLTAELVGRYRDERRPLSAIPLHGDTSALTAIGNDYGPEEAFARQVRAHGRPGDVLIALSTSGRSANVIAAVEAANAAGITTLALTGEAPNPLADACDEAACLAARSPATVQELHLAAVHMLCEAIDAAMSRPAEQAPEVQR